MKHLTVEWLDSYSSDSWCEKEQAAQWEPVRCVTSGWLIQDTEHALTLASTISRNTEQVMGVVAIPKCAIQHQQEN